MSTYTHEGSGYTVKHKIDPCKPIPSQYNEYEHEAAVCQKWEDKAFHEDRNSEYYIAHRREWKTKKHLIYKMYDGKKKDGPRAHLVRCHDGTIIVNNKADFGLCHMGCLTSYWNVQYDPKTGEVIERTRMTDEQSREFCESHPEVEFGRPVSPFIKKFGDREVYDVMSEHKDRLYQHAQQVIEEIGHVPLVSVDEHFRLTEKYKNKDNIPRLDMSLLKLCKAGDGFTRDGTMEEIFDDTEIKTHTYKRHPDDEKEVVYPYTQAALADQLAKEAEYYDMELLDQFQKNGTVGGAADICEASGHDYWRETWRAIYVHEPGERDQVVFTKGSDKNFQMKKGEVEIGRRDNPVNTLEEAKAIADERSIFIVKIKSPDAEKPNKNGRVYVNQSKDPVVAYKKNGVWMSDMDQLEYLDEYQEILENIPQAPPWKPGFLAKVLNNDGRETCFECGSPTKPIDTGLSSDMRVCTKCGK